MLFDTNVIGPAMRWAAYGQGPPAAEVVDALEEVRRLCIRRKATAAVTGIVKPLHADVRWAALEGSRNRGVLSVQSFCPEHGGR